MMRERTHAVLSRAVVVLAWIALAWNCMTQGGLTGVPPRVYPVEVLSVAALGICGGGLLWLNLCGARRWYRTVFGAGILLAAASFGAGLCNESCMEHGVLPPPPVIMRASVILGILAFACILAGGVFGALLRPARKSGENSTGPAREV